MKKLKFKIVSVFVLLWVFTKCEKDDICISSVADTPNVVILMLDKDASKKRTPLGFLIRPIGTEKQLVENSSDSLALPLQLTKSVTEFEFITNNGAGDENIDTLQINYRRIDQFINGACGYRANFILKKSPIFILNSGDNWIKGAIIIKDTVSDEISAHLGILY